MFLFPFLQQLILLVAVLTSLVQVFYPFVFLALASFRSTTFLSGGGLSGNSGRIAARKRSSTMANRARESMGWGAGAR